MTIQNTRVKPHNDAIEETNKKAAKNGHQIPRMRQMICNSKKRNLKKWHHIYNMKQAKNSQLGPI